MTKKTPSIFILDVDGVLTNGQFLYTDKGKVMKIFGRMIMMLYHF